MDKEKLNWRSICDKRSKDTNQGILSTKWNLRATPTLYLLDHKGIIRYKWLGGPGEKVIDDAIAKLLEEAQSDRK